MQSWGCLSWQTHDNLAKGGIFSANTLSITDCRFLCNNLSWRLPCLWLGISYGRQVHEILLQLCLVPAMAHKFKIISTVDMYTISCGSVHKQELFEIFSSLTLHTHWACRDSDCREWQESAACSRPSTVKENTSVSHQKVTMPASTDSTGSTLLLELPTGSSASMQFMKLVMTTSLIASHWERVCQSAYQA